MRPAPGTLRATTNLRLTPTRTWSRTSPGGSPSRSTPPASSTSSWPSSAAGKPPTATPRAGSSRHPTRPWERSWRWSAASRSSPARAPTRSSTSCPSPSRWRRPEGSAGININATVPSQDLAGRPARPETDPATGVWGQIRDQTAVVVADGGTFNQGVHGRPTARAYGAYVADVFLPMVIPFIPGTNALWDPWQGSHNGKGLTEDAFDNATKVILNQDFVSGLTQPAKLLDYFPYLAPPPES